MREKILLVEDNPDSCAYLAQLLHIKGYEVQTAADGLEALDKVQSFSPDLIISDMMMPRLDGVQFLRLLRNTIKYRHIPVIMVSAYGSGNLQEAVQAGADAVMKKPFDFDWFFKSLANVLYQSAKRHFPKQNRHKG